jgi:hypothetical protein
MKQNTALVAEDQALMQDTGSPIHMNPRLSGPLSFSPVFSKR